MAKTRILFYRIGEFRWYFEIQFILCSLTVIFRFISHKNVQYNLISAEILKIRGNSQFWRKRALFFKKCLISAEILIFNSNSRLSTKSQRKCDYFRQKTLNIVCHDPQIRSIFLIFRFALISPEKQPLKVEGQNMRRKSRIAGGCALTSQLFHSAFLQNLFTVLVINRL